MIKRYFTTIRELYDLKKAFITIYHKEPIIYISAVNASIDIVSVVNKLNRKIIFLEDKKLGHFNEQYLILIDGGNSLAIDVEDELNHNTAYFVARFE